MKHNHLFHVSHLLIAFMLIAAIVKGQETKTQTIFANRKLQELSNQMPGLNWPDKDTIMGYSKLLNDKSLIIRFNSQQEIEHLGISLFSQETKVMINESICDFLERLILELALQKTSDDVKRKLTEYHIYLKYNGYNFGEPNNSSLNHILRELKMPVNFTLQYEDKLGLATWKIDSKKELSILFPISRELIDGTDKKESDSQLYERLILSKAQPAPGKDFLIDENSLEPQGKEVYLRKGSQFILPVLTSDAYFTRSKSGYTPFFDIDQPEKSLCTLFQTYAQGNNTLLRITHRQYGYFTPEVEIPLSSFLSMFQKDFEVFCSTEKNKKGEWQMTVVIHHKMLNYIHLLRTTTTTENLLKDPLVLKADFYSNIPQHYIKSLFNTK